MTRQAMSETDVPTSGDEFQGETGRQHVAPAGELSSGVGLPGFGSRSEDGRLRPPAAEGDSVARACSYAIPANSTDNGGEC